MNLHGIHCCSVRCLDPVPVAALLWFKTILNHQDFCFQTVLPKCLEFFRSDGLTLKGCWDIFGMTASWIWTAFSSPKNHPIEEENHLNQTSMTLGFLALNFPGCTDSSRTAVILRQKKYRELRWKTPWAPPSRHLLKILLGGDMLVQQTGSHHLALLPGTSLRPRTCAGKCHSCNAKSPNNFRPSSCSRRRPKKGPKSPGGREKKQDGAATFTFLKIFHMYYKHTKGTVCCWFLEVPTLPKPRPSGHRALAPCLEATS